jgi:hypothetical protein
MRRSIFRREVKAVVLENKLLESDEFKLLDAIFQGSKTDASEQYLLKSDILQERDVQGALDGYSEKVKSDIISLLFMTSDLYLPKSISSSLHQKEFIAVFVGSGVSKLMGLPLWDELACEAIEHLFRHGYISFNERECIKSGTSAKAMLSIFHQSLETHQLKSFYGQVFSPKTKLTPYKFIASVDLPKISLNLDDELWKAMNDNPSLLKSGSDEQDHVERKYQRECQSFDSDTRIKEDCLYQIHGSIQTIEEHSIITMKDYLENYYSERKNLQNFLRQLSHTRKLIFLGCGMEEMELLGPILLGGKRHLVVVGTFMGEKRYFEIQRKYFDNLGMDVHGFYLDFTGYDRLNSLIETWMKKIQSEMSQSFMSKVGEIDGVIL